MSDGIIYKERPVKESLRSLTQVRESLFVAQSFLQSDSIAKTINDLVHHQLLKQLGDATNGVELCIKTLSDSIDHGDDEVASVVAIPVMLKP